MSTKSKTILSDIPKGHSPTMLNIKAKSWKGYRIYKIGESERPTSVDVAQVLPASILTATNRLNESFNTRL
ncbi:unnamed protein product [Lathyrus oleraceus]